MISICFILFLLISSLTSNYGQVTCASGWIQNGGSCYLINPAFNPGGPNGNMLGSWDQCNAYCTASYPGATMLCVNNAAENDWIRSHDDNVFDDDDNLIYMWIGYTDMLPYGGGKGTKQYGWVTGCSSTYTNWNAGEPNNAYNNEDYAHFWHSGAWNDATPQQQMYCGCEYNSALTMTPSSRPSTAPTSRPSTVPSSGPTVVPSSRPTTAPSSGPLIAPSSNSTSSPTATPSFSSSHGDISE